MTRVLVDMSATLLHHGHIRLLKLAKKHGQVIVALTTDEEIKDKKGYTPEINYASRKEILEAIIYVDDVVPSPWLLDNKFLDKHNIDYLVHGSDNTNLVDKDKLIVYPRTSGISSSLIREKILQRKS